MSSWLSRNAAPIGLVLFASALVIGGFEIIDALATSEAAPIDTQADGPTGIASIAGLIKVAFFLAIGALIARPIRRRTSADRATAEQP